MKDKNFKTIFKNVFTTHYSIPFALCFIVIITIIIVFNIWPDKVERDWNYEAVMSKTTLDVTQKSVYCSEIRIIDSKDPKLKRVFFKDRFSNFSTTIDILTDDYVVGQSYFANVYILKNPNTKLGYKREIDIVTENALPTDLSERKANMAKSVSETKIIEKQAAIPFVLSALFIVVFGCLLLKLLEFFDNIKIETKQLYSTNPINKK